MTLYDTIHLVAMAALATAAVSLLQLSSPGSSCTGEATRDTGAEAETGAFSEDLAGLLANLLAGVLAGLLAGVLAGPDLVLRDLSCRAAVVVVETGVTGVITSPGLKWTWQTHGLQSYHYGLRITSCMTCISTHKHRARQICFVTAVWATLLQWNSTSSELETNLRKV